MIDIKNGETDTLFQNIGVIGAGAWGTALAMSCHRAGRNVTLWALEQEVVKSINEDHQNTTFLPKIKIPPAIKATNNLKDIADCDLILMVTPAQHLRSTLKQLQQAKMENLTAPIIICSKGIELKTGALLSNIMEETLPDHPFAILSGPTFAIEVARNAPSGLTLACSDRTLGFKILDSLGHKTFRIYYSDDPVGAQICGAVKNVMAIACGVVQGRDMGENARALLLTRGLEEIWRLGSVMGAKRETLMGLAGLGDLTLTCSSMKSRNFSLGVMLGQGKSLKEILATRQSVTEGVHTAAAVVDLAARHAVEMPICQAVNDTLNNNIPVEDTINALLSRPFRDEHKN